MDATQPIGNCTVGGEGHDVHIMCNHGVNSDFVPPLPTISDGGVMFGGGPTTVHCGPTQKYSTIEYTKPVTVRIGGDYACIYADDGVITIIPGVVNEHTAGSRILTWMLGPVRWAQWKWRCFRQWLRRDEE